MLISVQVLRDMSHELKWALAANHVVNEVAFAAR